MTTDLSVPLYHYLCQKLGTEDVVKTRRLGYAIMDYIASVSRLIPMTLFGRTFTMICSGSKAEGLDMKSSDLDIMFLIDLVNVVENPLEGSGLLSFIISPEHTKPGFVRLKLHYSVFQEVYKCCKVRDGNVFLSSEIWKTFHYSKLKKLIDVIH